MEEEIKVYLFSYMDNESVELIGKNTLLGHVFDKYCREKDLDPRYTLFYFGDEQMDPEDLGETVFEFSQVIRVRYLKNKPSSTDDWELYDRDFKKQFENVIMRISKRKAMEIQDDSNHPVTNMAIGMAILVLGITCLAVPSISFDEKLNLYENLLELDDKTK